MKIRGVDVPINVFAELEPYLNKFGDYRIRGDKLQSLSPFRYERHPSFAVNLENGTWVDSGSPTEDYHKGNFITLLAYLRQEEYTDTEDYLIRAYNVMLEEVNKLQLTIKLTKENPVVFNWKDLKHLHYRHPYLARRGISIEVQRLFMIGYDKEHEAIAMPWIDLNKEIINIKYRSIRHKMFFYQEKGQLVQNYIYGLAQCKYLGKHRIVIVESEIDAMSLWTIGIPAVATGHSGMNLVQLRQLLDVTIEEVTIMTDADTAGWRFQDSLIKLLPKYFVTYTTDILRYGVNDVNDLLMAGKLQDCYSNRKLVNLFKLR